MRIVRSHQDDCGEIIVLSGDGIPHEIRIEKNGKSLVGFSIEPDGRITITDYAHARHKIFVDSNRTLYPDATWDGSMGW